MKATIFDIHSSSLWRQSLCNFFFQFLAVGMYTVLHVRRLARRRTQMSELQNDLGNQERRILRKILRNLKLTSFETHDSTSSESNNDDLIGFKYRNPKIITLLDSNDDHVIFQNWITVTSLESNSDVVIGIQRRWRHWILTISALLDTNSADVIEL